MAYVRAMTHGSRHTVHSKPPNVVTRWGTNPNVGNLEWGSESEFLTELLR